MPDSDPSQPKVDAFFRPVSREESAPPVVGVAQTQPTDVNAAVREAIATGSTVVLTTVTITPPTHPEVERAKKKQEFADRRARIVANMGMYKWLGQIPEYKTLVEECKDYGWKPCSSLACTHPIKALGEFFNDAKSPDGKKSCCNACSNGEGGAARVAAAEAAKQRAHEVVQVIAPKSSQSAVEDEASDHLKEALEARGVVFEKTLEFRRADAGTKPATVATDAYTRVQVKSDGAYHETSALKPNNSRQGKGGGKAHFTACKGYKDMWVLFVKTRLAADGTRVRTYWLVKGEDVDKDSLEESVNGTIGPQKFAPVTIDQVVETLLHSTLPTASMATLNDELGRATQRKEVVGMRAIGFVTGFPVTFTAGNQTSVDCTIDNRAAAQVKGYNLKNGNASAHHCVNGVHNQAYHVCDGIDLLFEYLTVKSGDDFYFLYAVQPRRKLIKHGIFAHDGTKKRPPSCGKSTISIPLDDELNLWLIGRTKTNTAPTAWLKNPLYNFTNPVKITAAEIGVPPEWLEEAAQPAANHDAFPSAEFLDAREAKIDEACRSVGTKRKRE
jgi:hypothetical protein